VLRVASCNQDCYTKEASPAELDAHLRERERSGRWHDHVLPALSAMTCRVTYRGVVVISAGSAAPVRVHVTAIRR